MVVFFQYYFSVIGQSVSEDRRSPYVYDKKIALAILGRARELAKFTPNKTDKASPLQFPMDNQITLFIVLSQIPATITCL